MIDVSNGIKTSYDLSTVQYDKIVIDNIDFAVNNVEFYDDCYIDGNIFGTAIAKCIDFEIENITNLEGQEFEYYTGVLVDNEVNWISLGNFIVQDVEINDTTNIVKVSAIDYMLKTNIEYKSELNYSGGNVTLLNVLEEACQNAGIELDTTIFTNSTFIVDSNQFESNTLIRQVIQAVAQISGTVAKIRNNKLKLLSAGTSVCKVFTLNSYKEAEIKRLTHPINALSLGMKEIEGENVVLRDEELISVQGENFLIINDNPFAYTQAKRAELITELFNAVKGFEYKAFSFVCQGLPYLETMDKIQFKDSENNTYESYIFRFNFKSPKGLESTIEAPSIIKATVEYQNVLNAIDIAKRTEILVNKQEQTITQVVETTTELDLQIQDIDKNTNNNYQEIKTSLEDYVKENEMVALRQSVETAQNNSEYAINISQDILVNGVSKVNTNTGYTFNEEGLTIEKTDSKTKTTLNEIGLNVKDSTGISEESLLFAGFDNETGETIVKSKNMTVEKYFVVGKSSRIEDYIQDGNNYTGIFWIGG